MGVYSAAIIHLILHGIFKATLFLQSGSVVRRFNIPEIDQAKINALIKIYGLWLLVIKNTIAIINARALPSILSLYHGINL
jgi:NAD(P)H-quinone oxidoreductase subunit 5